MVADRSKRLLKVGVPFFVMVFGGGLAILQFSKVKYKHGRNPKNLLSKEEVEDMKKKGIIFASDREALERAHAKLQAEEDNDNWTNIRGPRPWEEPTQEYLDKKKRLQATGKLIQGAVIRQDKEVQR